MNNNTEQQILDCSAAIGEAINGRSFAAVAPAMALVMGYMCDQLETDEQRANLINLFKVTLFNAMQDDGTEPKGTIQ